MSSQTWTSLSLFALVALTTTVALAHPGVDEGRRLYEEAQFVESLDALTTAERAAHLSREELIQLFETRALVHLALSNEPQMRQDLMRIVSLAPDHVLDRRIHPDVRRTFAEVRAEHRGAIRLRARPRAAPAGVTIEAEVDRDPLGLVQTVRIFGRTSGASDWALQTDAPLLVASDAGVVEYYAEALGPGAVVIASAGSSEAPLQFAAAAELRSGAASDDTGLHIGIMAGVGGAVAIGVVIAIVLLTGDSANRETSVEPFSVQF